VCILLVFFTCVYHDARFRECKARQCSFILVTFLVFKNGWSAAQALDFIN